LTRTTGDRNEWCGLGAPAPANQSEPPRSMFLPLPLLILAPAAGSN
jgi:hypothetical protein